MRKLVVSMVLASSAFLASSRADAQTVPAFDINRFNPAERGSEWFALDTLDMRGQFRPAFGFTSEWAFKPLAIPTGDGTHTTLVQDQFTTHFGASAVFGDSIRMGLNVPMVFYQNGDTTVLGLDRYAAPDKPRLADARVSLDVRLYGKYGDPITMAVGGQLFFPTGSRNLFTGDETSHGIVHILGSGERGMFVYSGSVGVHVRGLHTSYAGQRVGDEMLIAAAGGVRILDKKLVAGPEIYFSRQMSQPGEVFRGDSTAVEFLFGAHYTFLQDFRIGAGAGPGVGGAYGSPDGRVLLSFDWAPHYVPPPPPPPDRDGDGIPDAQDTCPDEYGMRTPDVRTHGCAVSDRDRDGIPDQWDACPDTPGYPSADIRVHGCLPRDSDRDGVPDVWDACPGEVGTGNADMRHHGCAPHDTDKDGIPDLQDACPDKPGKRTMDPKTNGCPSGDRDADGIKNEVDACPDEPGKPDPDPKKNGCPKAFVANGQINITEQVKFKTGSAAIETDAATKEVLDAVLDVLNKHPELKKIRVEGHTDNVGVPADNKKLSAARADSVVKYLAAHGVAKERLGAEGFGQEKPLQDNKTPEGRKANRRVEFHIEQ